MRHILFALVLVGASFLGGAFVNGPGMKWLQAKVLGHAGLGEEVPSVSLPAQIASEDEQRPAGKSSDSAVTAKNTTSPSKHTTQSKSPSSRKSSGNGRMASAKVDAGAPKPEPAENPKPETKSGLGNMLGSLLSLGDSVASAKEVKPSTDGNVGNPIPNPKSTAAKSTPAPNSLAAAQGTKPAPAGQGPESTPNPDFEIPPPGAGRPAPLDPSVTPAFLASLGSTPPPSNALVNSNTKPQVIQASASSEPRPLAIPLPKKEPNPGTPQMESAPSSIQDEWGIIRHKLKSLGVTRYTIDGEPGGKVSFACLIPVAGRQSVAQRFEAEGEDEVQAARAALRRIALWQAAEHGRAAR